MSCIVKGMENITEFQTAMQAYRNAHILQSNKLTVAKVEENQNNGVLAKTDPLIYIVDFPISGDTLTKLKLK